MKNFIKKWDDFNGDFVFTVLTISTFTLGVTIVYTLLENLIKIFS